jgi:hypothetical protein
MKKLFITLTIAFTLGCNNKQQSIKKQNEYIPEALLKNKVGIEYISNQTKNELDKTVDVYLGQLNSQTIVYKLLFKMKYWGQNYNAIHANSYLYIFDNENNYLGFYPLGGVLKTKPYIKNNKLYVSSGLKCSTLNQFDFSTKIPKEIFLECENGYGDIYKFQK